MTDIRILHVSDLHYEQPDANYQDDDKAGVDPAFRDSAFRNLHTILKLCFPESAFDLVAVSGDITTHGKTKGFTDFGERTAPWLRKLVRNSKAVCMTPGNHDVTWGLDPGSPDYFDKKFQDYLAAVQKLQATTSLVPSGGLPLDGHSDLDFVDGVGEPLYWDADKKLLVLSLNSSIRCGEVNRTLRAALCKPIEEILKRVSLVSAGIEPDHPNAGDLDAAARLLRTLLPKAQKQSLSDIPHVTQTQLHRLLELLTRTRNEMKDDWASLFRVAVMHHHAVPFEYQKPEHKPFELMADAASVLALLGSFGFQLVLTGHKHQPYIQKVRFQQSEMLIVGGMTVGGYPVARFGPGLRHIEMERDGSQMIVRVADLPCDWMGDTSTQVQQLIDRAHQERVDVAPRALRVGYPAGIERAVDTQMYGRPFYKSNVLYDIEVTELPGGSLCFTTIMSYVVVNRSESIQTWRTRYSFNRPELGKVLEAKFNGRDVDFEQPEFKDGRGLSFPSDLSPQGGKGEVYVKIQEEFPAEGSNYYTTYNPATDLKLILREKQVPQIEFDLEIMYFWDVFPVVRGEYREVRLDGGLLPYQGVRVNWRKRSNGNEA